MSAPIVPFRVPTVATAFSGSRPITQALLSTADIKQIIDALEFAQTALLQFVTDSDKDLGVCVGDTLRQSASNWYEIRLKLTRFVNPSEEEWPNARNQDR